jgi:hypothetical protein
VIGVKLMLFPFINPVTRNDFFGQYHFSQLHAWTSRKSQQIVEKRKRYLALPVEGIGCAFVKGKGTKFIFTQIQKQYLKN